MPALFELGLTDHVEGPGNRASASVYDEVAEMVRVADALGVKYAWFAEHHAHAHEGHLPAPLLMAVHMAGQTRQIQLGMAVICLNLHHPLDVGEQTAVADTLMAGRLAPGFGSGSAPEEYPIFGSVELSEDERHARFEEALRLVTAAWAGRVEPYGLRFFSTTAHQPLPIARPDLVSRSWVAVNSVGAARVAGRLGFNVMFSHLRTTTEHQRYLTAYRESSGTGHIAANFPIYVGKNDAEAIEQAEPALRILWRRFQAEGKIPVAAREPKSIAGLCAHPINFIVGGPERVATTLLDLHARCAFDVANLQLRWAGISPERALDSLRRLVGDVMCRCC
jgi:alkanesulfonate monooxygenase SsuD/methylene tetrahydromethanopterin reductase-like flavin-dependent oxidoreductase (luciferase family)